ncbi:exported hypothetical protein [Cupriavidus taiwanensis]|nr:exported hypothetical protein [Cupriavidus taiwanensis]SOZ29023.1 exported hypothetical protein [Cupriavidus taiwanensis]SOZ46483.1 exported hypothetical protein [Cupriavidus taiwanensis]
MSLTLYFFAASFAIVGSAVIVLLELAPVGRGREF